MVTKHYLWQPIKQKPIRKSLVLVSWPCEGGSFAAVVYFTAVAGLSLFWGTLISRELIYTAYPDKGKVRKSRHERVCLSTKEKAVCSLAPRIIKAGHAHSLIFSNGGCPHMRYTLADSLHLWLAPSPPAAASCLPPPSPHAAFHFPLRGRVRIGGWVVEALTSPQPPSTVDRCLKFCVYWHLRQTATTEVQVATADKIKKGQQIN